MSGLGKYAAAGGRVAAGGRLAGRLLQLAAAASLVAPGGELLDLGCGSGELARHLAASGYRVTGCDIAPTMLSQAARPTARQCRPLDAAGAVLAARCRSRQPAWTRWCIERARVRAGSRRGAR